MCILHICSKYNEMESHCEVDHSVDELQKDQRSFYRVALVDLI